MANFVTITDRNFSKGINQLSAESQIQQGYVEDCLNADAEPEGYVAKRKGYETHQSVPVRVTRMTQDPGAPGTVCFYLDGSIDVSSSVDVSRLRSSPIFVYGKTQLTGTYDFTTTPVGRYYTAFTNDVRLSFAVGLNQTATYTADAHGFDTASLLVGITQSTSEVTRDNSLFLPSLINIFTSDYSVIYTADNSGPSVLQTYAYVLDNSNQSGLAYTQGGLTPTPSGMGYDFISIPAATHQLANTDILVQIYDETTTPGSYEFVLADQVINTSGNIEIRFAPAWTGGDVRVCLRSVPVSKTREGTAVAGASTSVLLNSLVTPFVIAQAFLETSPGVWELVLPEALDVNSEVSEATVSFQNTAATDSRFRVLWAEAEVRTNELCVEEQTNSTIPADTANGSTADLELSIWGLDHGEIYADPREDKPGWVTAVDSYRSEGEAYLCATLGWNLFREAFRASEGATYGLVERWPRLRQRTTATRILAPLFHGTGDTVERTRGGYTILGGESGWGQVTSVTYTGTPGLVQVTVATPSRATTLNSSASEADLFLPEEANTTADLLSLRFSVWSQFDGDWPVTAVDFSSPLQLVFTVRMPDIDSADFDFTSQGEAGVFTDLTALDLADVTKGYMPVVGDILRSSSFGAGETFEVRGVRNQDSGSNVLVGPVYDTVTLPTGQLLTFSHTGRTLALRDDNPLSSDTYENIVRGDVLTIAGQASRRTVERLYIVASADGTLEVDALGTSATFTLADTTTASLSLGQTLLVSKAGRLSGEWLVTGITSDNVFTASPSTSLASILPAYASETGVAFTVVPGHLELSLEGAFEDLEDSSITCTTESRLVPAEYPTSTDTLPTAAAYHTEHFSASPYGAQPLVRTTMANDSLFATNYEDPIQKWDGANLQRAGLPRWAPSVFVQKQAGGGIVVSPGKLIAGTSSTNVFTPTTAADVSVLTVGQQLTGSDGAVYTVESVDSAGKVTLTTTPAAPITSLTAFGLSTYRYYLRADAVDANGYTLATATYGSEDLRVQLTQSSDVVLRISGMPQWRGLPYDRIRLRIYRTKATGAAPFFQVYEADMPFSQGHSFSVANLQANGDYIDFSDANSDETLTKTDPLAAVLSRSGALGDTFLNVEPPPRAKFVTTIGNQAAYANVRSWPRIELQLVPTGAVTPVLAESWILRQDSSDTGTVTSPSTRFGFRFCESTAAGGGTVDTLSGTDIATGTDYFDVTLGAGIGRPAIGGWIYLFRNSAASAPRSIFNGWWPVASHPAANTVRITCPGMTAAVVYSDATDANRALITTTAAAQTDSLLHVPVYLGTDDFNYDTVSGNTADFAARVTSRLANAINAVMRQGYGSAFTPWAHALSGNQLSRGLQLEFPLALPTTPELQFGNTPAASPTGFTVFGNDTQRGATDSVGARILIRSSRVLLAPAGYPELVDNPFASFQGDSFSFVDINPADGQDITGIVPFFGESAFGGAVTSGQLVVFKTDSVYFLDPATRALTKVESQGVGCSAPGSIASTRQGVIFAHTSGLYRLTRATTVEPIGANLDRLWQLQVDKSSESFAVMQAHNFTATRRYRFLWPSLADIGVSGDQPRNSNLFSYDYTAEQKGEFGGWARYDNQNFTNACNLAGESYAGTWKGRLVRFLQEDTAESYRDEGAPVGMVRSFDTATSAIVLTGTGMQVTFRATDFGDEASRKKLLHVLLGFRLPVSSDGSGVTLSAVQVQQASELKDNYTTLDQATIVAAGPRDGMSSAVSIKQQTLRYSPEFTKAIYHQLRVSDQTLSAPVQIVSLGYRVSGLNSKGTEQAANT